MALDPDTLKAATGSIAQVATEVYKDVAQPSAKRVGVALETVFKIGLSPLALLDSGYEHSKNWLEEKVRVRLAQMPADSVTTPPNNIAVPALTRIAMSADAPDLRELYAELLLKAMDARTSQSVHPAYIALIEQLIAEEAYIFVAMRERSDETLLGDCSSDDRYKEAPKTIEMQFQEQCKLLGVMGPERSPVWLNNLMRLGLFELKVYTETEVKNRPDGRYDDRPVRPETTESRELTFTAFGRAFRDACTPANDVV